MAEATATPPRERKQSGMVFEIEANHPRNGDLLLQSIPGLRLRSRLKATVKTIQGEERQAYMVTGPQPPQIPGMRVRVNTSSRTVVIRDPLYNNEELRDKLSEYFRRSTGTSVRPQGAEERQERVDRDRLKTLCREILRLEDMGYVEVTDGVIPSMDQIDSMAGDYLLNPGATIPNGQPNYEKDWDDYVQNARKHGI